MKKKTIIWIVAIAVLLIILLLVGKKAGWFGKSGNFKQVEITKVEPIDIAETVAATGKIQPEVEVSLSSEVSGEIIELPVKEGQQVEKGDLLVTRTGSIGTMAKRCNFKIRVGSFSCRLRSCTS